MSLKSFLRGTVFAGASAFLIAIPMTASASHGEDLDVSINPGNVPTTAEFGGGCDNLPELGEFEDGWVFIVPSEGDPDAHFNSVSATFEDNEGNEQTLGGTLVEGSGDNKAYIVTEAGWTLIGGSASINTTEGGADSFNLTHACPGTPPPEEPPPEEPPPEEPPPEEPPPEEPPPEEPPPEEPPAEEPPPEEPPAEEPPAEEPPAEEPPAEEPQAEEPPAEEPPAEEPPAEEPPAQEEEQEPAPEEEAEPPAQLPQTGEELTGLLLAAGALTAAGLGAYLFGRRHGRSGTD